MSADRARLEKRPTDNVQAYALYLTYAQARQEPALDRARNLAAVGLLRQALALDPAFAAAQSSIAFRYAVMGLYDDAS